MSRKGFENLTRKAVREQTVLTALLCIGATYLAVRYVQFPSVLIELPLLIAALLMSITPPRRCWVSARSW